MGDGAWMVLLTPLCGCSSSGEAHGATRFELALQVAKTNLCPSNRLSFHLERTIATSESCPRRR